MKSDKYRAEAKEHLTAAVEGIGAAVLGVFALAMFLLWGIRDLGLWAYSEIRAIIEDWQDD